VLRAAAVASVRSANAHAQVIDNGLDLLMITPLERM
jgi:arginyl-tRNA synthetase